LSFRKKEKKRGEKEENQTKMLMKITTTKFILELLFLYLLKSLTKNEKI
jgi:hypothetical protein